jgi:acetate kinase
MYTVNLGTSLWLFENGGADAIVLTVGIGKKSPKIRAEICSGMDWVGLYLDPGKNQAAVVKA